MIINNERLNMIKPDKPTTNNNYNNGGIQQPSMPQTGEYGRLHHHQWSSNHGVSAEFPGSKHLKEAVGCLCSFLSKISPRELPLKPTFRLCTWCWMRMMCLGWWNIERIPQQNPLVLTSSDQSSLAGIMECHGKCQGQFKCF